MSELGQRLREERERLQMTQTDFGRLGGVSKHSQIRYERGDGTPDVDYLRGVASHGVDVHYVISGIREGAAAQRSAAGVAAAAVDLVGEVMSEMDLQGRLSIDEIKTLVRFVIDNQADRDQLRAFVKGATQVFRPDLSGPDFGGM